MNRITLISILILMGIMVTGIAIIGLNNPYVTSKIVPGFGPILPYNAASVSTMTSSTFSRTGTATTTVGSTSHSTTNSTTSGSQSSTSSSSTSLHGHHP